MHIPHINYPFFKLTTVVPLLEYHQIPVFIVILAENYNKTIAKNKVLYFIEHFAMSFLRA